ncbi:MAG: HAD-IIA family hydrolase [Chitinispirillaceae bacterium]|nr:HAD-IIA family hydrolase [Chitinispirillaceae bacterium]
MKPDLLERLRCVKLFLLDLDGTVYLGSKPIPGALDFIGNLKRCGIGYLFLTNNSSKSAAEYVAKLTAMGFSVGPDRVVTSGQVTGWYLAGKKPGAKLYVVGTASLKAELAAHDLRVVNDAAGGVDFVVAGFDRELTYDKLLVAVELLAGGAPFIATNPDLVCPVGENRYIPDCGSICVLLENAARRTPMFIGKPHTKMVDYIRALHHVSPRSMAVIGDRLYTDIALGCNASIMSICVLSGESDKSAVAKSPYKPDLVIETVAELNRFFK